MKAWGVFFSEPVSYADGLRIQQSIHAARLQDEIPDTILFLQHTPVVTLGRRGRTQHLLLQKEELAKRGVELHESSRGGDVTYHGPGQLVMYPIIRIGMNGPDSHGYLHNLEETAIRTASSYGIEAWRREGKSGAWTEKGKIAAIGFKLQRWVSMHGMSFNVEADLAGFQMIVPCGLAGEPIASLRGVLHEKCPTVTETADVMAGHFEDVCDRQLERFQVGGDMPDDLAGLM